MNQGEKSIDLRIKIDNYLQDNIEQHIEDHIIADLKTDQKRISSMFFYDDVGSKLFETITTLPEYYLTRTEIPLIKKVAERLKDQLKDVDIIEFGSGDCSKISILLDVIDNTNRDTVCYVPFDVSVNAVEKSSNILLEKYPGIKIHAIIADFMSQLDVLSKNRKKIICFLGSTIGNFSPEDAQFFLSELSRIMKEDDLLLLGFDMIKDKKILEDAYNDERDVTADFNKNILNVVNKLINSNFDPSNFEHIAFYNKDLNRIEMHLKALKDMSIKSPYLSYDVSLKQGETIHTENSYKFSKKQIRSLAKKANLHVQEIFTDKNNWFSLVLLAKGKE